MSEVFDHLNDLELLNILTDIDHFDHFDEATPMSNGHEEILPIYDTGRYRDNVCRGWSIPGFGSPGFIWTVLPSDGRSRAILSGLSLSFSEALHGVERVVGEAQARVEVCGLRVRTELGSDVRLARV